MGVDFKTLLPAEGTYETWMKETVEPYLLSLRDEGILPLYDGGYLHYEYEELPGAIGAVVISHGFVESAEKFREMAYWFLQMGYSVYALDHRGHGRSVRTDPDYAMTDVPSFAHYVKDLHCFVNRIVKPSAKDLPLYIYGHSMGGAITTLYLQSHPGVFQKAILTAPMIKPKTNGIPAPLTRIMTRAFRIAGKGSDLVFVQKPGFDANERFEDAPDTSFERFEYYRQKRVHDVYLQNSHPSYRWVGESLSIVDIMLDRSRCQRMTLPILLFSAGSDDFVYRREQELLISRVPNGEIVYEERAKHEIYMSTNDVMYDYLSKIESFLA